MYMAEYDGHPGSTVIDMGAGNQAPRKDLSFVLVTGVTFTDCTSDGMPSSAQFDDLYKISDSVKNAITQKVKSKLVGTFTHQCKRLDYYYVADTSGLRKLLNSIYSRSFSSYKPYLNMKQDKAWEYYLKFLYPNEQTIEYMENQKVLANLQKAGDKLTQPRQLDHWLYFSTQADLDSFLPYVTRLHFKVESKSFDKSFRKPYQLKISRVDTPELASISALTYQLKTEAKKCKGEYDGWETVVIK